MTAHALANLRHLYEQMCSGAVTDTAEAARGLLGPAIAALEATASPGSAGARDLAGPIDKLTTAAEEAGREQGYAAAKGIAHTLTRMLAVVDDAIAGLVSASLSGPLTGGCAIGDCLEHATHIEHGARVRWPDATVTLLTCAEHADEGAVPITTLTPPVVTGPRVPSPNWVDRGDGYHDLIAGDHMRCHASPDRTIQPEAPFSWRVSAHLGSVEHVRASSHGAPPCDTLEAAQLAAEDALHAIATAALRAIGR